MLCSLSLCPQLLYQKGIKKPREAWLGLMSACNPKQLFCFYVILSDIFSLLSTKRSSLFQGINHSLILWHSKFLLSICTSLLGRHDFVDFVITKFYIYYSELFFFFFCLFVLYWKLWIWDTSCVLYWIFGIVQLQFWLKLNQIGWE